MSYEDKIAFFDGIAEKWDTWEDLDEQAKKLDVGLRDLDIKGDEQILDVGCGTGNLTAALLRALSPQGRVVAVDISPAMVAKAKEKIQDPRVKWHVTSVEDLPLPDTSLHRVMCFSVWPHVDCPRVALREIRRVLRPAGILHVWHIDSRATINEIHATAGEAVRRDVLQPARKTAVLLEMSGFKPLKVIDDDSQYLITAAKAPARQKPTMKLPPVSPEDGPQGPGDTEPPTPEPG